LGINPTFSAWKYKYIPRSFFSFGLLRRRSITPVNLLLQNYAVNTGLEKREGQACLALELAKAIEDFCAGI
jgi:hypothetical protein